MVLIKSRKQPLPKVHEYKDRKGEHRYKVVAANGKTISAATEGYKRKAAMRKAMRLSADAVMDYLANPFIAAHK